MLECGGGDQTASSATLSALPASVSASPLASSSPKSRVKFMCSYGGKILPRPADGHLKYVGGETRVVAVLRDISFAELMQKLSNFYEGEFVLKYQISSEDLDALISVRSDEDLRHMFDEYNRQEAGGTPKLRAFLFQSKPLIVDNQTMEPHALEQRYVDAINGIVRRNNLPRRMSINTSRPTFTISSACSSPKPLSPNSPTPIPMGYEAVPASNLQTSRPLPMHRVQSSPTLCSFNNNENHLYQQNLKNPQVHQHHHCYQNQQQHSHHHHGMPHSRTSEPRRSGGEKAVPALSMGWADSGRSQMGRSWNQYYLSTRYHRGGGGINCGHPECGGYGCGRPERTDVPQSPRGLIWE